MKAKYKCKQTPHSIILIPEKWDVLDSKLGLSCQFNVFFCVLNGSISGRREDSKDLSTNLIKHLLLTAAVCIALCIQGLYYTTWFLLTMKKCNVLLDLLINSILYHSGLELESCFIVGFGCGTWLKKDQDIPSKEPSKVCLFWDMEPTDKNNNISENLKNFV